MLRKLFITRIHVKPDINGAWFVMRESPIESLIDDCWRYGFRIAWHNFKWILQEHNQDE